MAALAELSEGPVALPRAAEDVAAGPRPRRRPEHLLQIDLLRIVAIVAVVGTHVVLFTQPPTAVGAQALTVLLHVSRFAFFFITAFVLYLTSGSRAVSVLPFWRKRFLPVLIPFVAWTLIYWQYNRLFPWGGYPSTLEGALYQLGVNLLGGWFQLYFLIVTMQLYLAFPLIAWIVRRTRGHHLHLLIVSGAVQVVGLLFMQYLGGLIPGFLQGIVAHAQEELWSYQFFFFVGAVAADHREQLIAALRRYRVGLLALVAGLLGAAFLLYGLNLLLGQGPAQAAGVFQPATVLAFFGAVLGLGLLAQHLADTRSSGSLVWRLLRWGGEISFGIYLSHMIALQVFVLPQVRSLLHLSALSTPVQGIAIWALTVGATILLVSILRYLPFATALTGRPRRPLPAFRRQPLAVERESA
jgi:peptidoglycan/LPS O-acetylase OafA/YrhL